MSKEADYVESEGVDTNLGRLSLGRAGELWLVYLNDDEMCCGISEPYARAWYGAADFWQDRTAKQGRRGGPFGGETGGEVYEPRDIAVLFYGTSLGHHLRYRPDPEGPSQDVPVSCVDPWAEVKP